MFENPGIFVYKTEFEGENITKKWRIRWGLRWEFRRELRRELRREFGRELRGVWIGLKGKFSRK